MPFVRTITLSDGTVKPTTLRVPYEEAAKLDDEMMRVRETWLHNPRKRAAPRAANRPVQPVIPPPDEPSAA